MDVRFYPNWRRPGVGQRPRRAAQRPHLPQHARHCPVLEAGNSLGFLVYPPLEQHEAFKVGYEGEGQYRFVYYVNPGGAKWEPVLTVAVTLSTGGLGMSKEEVTFVAGVPNATREHGMLLARMFIVPEDLGTPAGAVTLRGAWNFQTDSGWDTVFTPVFNAVERPIVPMMVIRVETDWYAHESEFRFILQPGEVISASHHLPIGQAFFVPREQIHARDCSPEELEALRAASGEFQRAKHAVQLTTSYGLEYSPHYLRQSRSMEVPARAQAVGATTSVGSDVAAAAPPDGTATPRVRAVGDPPATKVGRNAPCPCGSGKKYKKCHGEGAA